MTTSQVTEQDHLTAKGTGDAEGNFSMTVNASGKGSSDMQTDMDAANNTRMNGTTDLRTESMAYNHYAPVTK